MPEFGIKIFKIDFVIDFKWYLTFDLSPGSQGAGQKMPLRAPFMWVSHTPNLVEYRPTV